MGYKLAFASELEDVIKAKCDEGGWEILSIECHAGGGSSFKLEIDIVAPRKEKTEPPT